MFNAMNNYTNPVAVMDQRRGVIAGGRYSLRTPVMDVQILSILPPSYQAGCGGIDLFGGSFSFISVDRFTELLRSIAANAPAYAFRMAMQAMCPSCDQIMQEMQSIIQKLNGLTVNSCQAAESLVSTGANAIRQITGNASSKVAVNQGAVDDALTGWFPSMSAGEKPIHALAETDLGGLEEKGIVGNIVWNALNDANVVAWFDGGDEDLLEAILSITGTIIIRPPASDDGEISVTPVPPILDIQSFMQGVGSTTQVQVYKCISSKCYDPNNVGGQLSDPTIHEVTVHSFRDRVEDMLTSISEKFEHNASLTNEEQAFMASMPSGIGGMIRNLTRQNGGVTSDFAYNIAPVVANIMVSRLVLKMIDAARTAASSYNSELTGQLIERFNQVESAVRQQSMNMKMANESIVRMLQAYGTRMTAARKYRMGISDVIQDSALKLH